MYGYTILCSCIHLLMGFFQVLTTTNQSVLNIHLKVFRWHMFLLRWQIPRSRIVGLYSKCLLNFLKIHFKETAKIFSNLTIPFFIPTSSKWEFQVLQNLTNTYDIYLCSSNQQWCWAPFHILTCWLLKYIIKRS